MICLTLKELALAAQGQLVNKQDGDIEINQISTDSRAIRKNEAFIALKGPNFDGHRFIKQVASLGCSVVIVEQLIEDLDNSLPKQIIVADTRIALGKIAAYVKEKVAPKTVGITGSSGKTTVKEMVAAILSQLGSVLATQGNFNNDIGVPLTLLRLEHRHDFAVVEMGANHIGEIAYTTNLVKPDVAIINNIAAAHLEGFGDLCGVARAKGEIFEGLTSTGIALYNQDCQYANKWQWRLTDKTVRTFSCINKAAENVTLFSSQVRLNAKGCASFVLNSELGQIDIELTIPGVHNVCNAMAAAAIAIEFGASLVDIQLGLAQVAPVKGRLNLHQLTTKFNLIDDTYNANVESIKAASDLLATYPGKKILILGDMGELGSVARSCHQEVGEHAFEQGVDSLLTLGVLSQSSTDAFSQSLNKTDQLGKMAEHFSDRQQLVSHLIEQLTTESQPISILVKGSRSAHMEHVVADVLTWHKQKMSKQTPKPEVSA